MLGHWLLASDLHVKPGNSAPLPAGYGTDTNWVLFQSTVSEMRKADPHPQVVILSGDFLAHHFPRSVPLAESEMTAIARAFDAAFPHAQFVIVPGNNDDPCGDYRATPGSAYFKYLAHLWAPLVNRNGAAPHFERDFGEYGWYTARLPVAHLRVVALDSVYWSLVYRRCGSEHPDAPQREMQWLSRTLSSLPNQTRAMVVMHIPPGIDAHSTLVTHRLLLVPFWRDAFATAFVRVLLKEQPRIAFAISGHMHRDDFRLFGGVPLLVAPSVSPVYDNNPAFLRFDVGAGGTLENYTPYLYDQWSNAWQKGDSFDSVYGVRGFTAASLASIHARLATDENLRKRWTLMLMSGSHYREITSGTWRTYWCAQTDMGQQFISCAGLQRRLQVLPIAAGVAVAGALALFALLWYSVSRKWKRPNKSA